MTTCTFVVAAGTESLHPDFAWAAWHCAPLVVAKAEVAAVRAALTERAAALGYAAVARLG